MRLFATALFSFMLLAASVGAATPHPSGASNGASSAGHSFGTAFCNPIECPDSINSLSPSDLSANASGCFHDHFGYGDVGELFSQTSGLDRNNCLSARPNVLPNRGGTQLAPVCCIIEQNSICKFRCSIVTAN
jgi:hypothetical protein